jgi:flagellar basal body rod protein FlgF
VGMMMDMIETSRNFQMQTEMTKMVFAAAQGQSSPLSLS